jgi:hypothetical protein
VAAQQQKNRERFKMTILPMAGIKQHEEEK